MFKDGKIIKEEIYIYFKKNIIIKVVGIEEELEVDIYEFVWEKGKDYCFLLCIDGFINMVFEIYIYKIFKENSFDEIGKRLIEKVFEVGGIDNIIVVYFLVWIKNKRCCEGDDVEWMSL